MSGPDAVRSQVLAFLDLMLGPGKFGKGRYFYAMSIRWACGAAIYFDKESVHFTMELPGDLLGEMTLSAQLQTLRDLSSMGLKATRLDLKLDVKGQAVGLVAAVRDGCAAGELCGARRWREVVEQGNAGRILGRTVYLGARGKMGSGRFGRVYDKGLETGEAAAGEWERFEVEFSGDAAAATAAAILLADDGQAAFEGFLLGAFDFRECNGERHLDRRPRAAWWAEFVSGSVLRRERQKRSKSDLVRYAAWFRRCVAPGMTAMCEATDEELPAVWRELVGDDCPVRDELFLRPVIWQWVQHRRRARGRAAGMVLTGGVA